MKALERRIATTLAVVSIAGVVDASAERANLLGSNVIEQKLALVGNFIDDRATEAFEADKDLIGNTTVKPAHPEDSHKPEGTFDVAERVGGVVLTHLVAAYYLAFPFRRRRSSKKSAHAPAAH